jgi:hypothetical protein
VRDAEIVELAIRRALESPHLGTIGRRALEEIADRIAHLLKEHPKQDE